jgi:hypothetical protein
MARDLVALMETLGHHRFHAVGHDRGGYVVQRLALDHPDRVDRVVILGDVPIGEALARCNARFATAWWHWFFMGQPAPLAERLIASDVGAWYGLDPGAMGEENYADVARVTASPSVQHAMCEDYRAGLGVDRTADDNDRMAGRQSSHDGGGASGTDTCAYRLLRCDMSSLDCCCIYYGGTPILLAVSRGQPGADAAHREGGHTCSQSTSETPMCSRPQRMIPPVRVSCSLLSRAPVCGSSRSRPVIVIAGSIA